MDMGREVRVIEVEEVRPIAPVEPIVVPDEIEPAAAEAQ
jgi:hypothetical protein